MTNQELIIQIADNMALLAKSIKHYAQNMLIERSEEETLPEKAVSLEEVRAVLAEKSAAGKGAEVRALLLQHGANKLSAIQPDQYADLLKEAEAL